MSRGKEYEGIHRKSSQQDKWHLQRRREIRQADEDARIAQLNAKKEKAIQAKLEISQEGDVHEQQADLIAKKVVNGDDANVNQLSPASTSVQSKSEGGGMQASDQLQAKLGSSKGSGQSMDDATKGEMETKMGTDFSDVKIHTGAHANEMSESINAKAFTHGQDVYFKGGNYNPSSDEGKELLAHELTHTVQQGEGMVQTKLQRYGDGPAGFTNPKAIIPIKNFITYVKAVESAYPTDTPLQILTRMRMMYYGSFAFQRLIPDASDSETKTTTGKPMKTYDAPWTTAENEGNQSYSRTRKLYEGEMDKTAYEHLTARANENSTSDAATQGDNPSPYIKLDNGEEIDLGHLLLALDALAHPETSAPYTSFDVPNIDPSAHVADIGIAAVWMDYYNAFGKEHDDVPVKAEKGVKPTFDEYYAMSSPEQDLLGDIDAFGVSQSVIKNLGKPGAGSTLSDIIYFYYCGQKNNTYSVDRRWRNFIDANKWTYDHTSGKLDPSVKKTLLDRVKKFCDLYSSGKLGALLTATYTIPRFYLPWPSASTAVDKFLKFVEENLQKEIAGKSTPILPKSAKKGAAAIRKAIPKATDKINKKSELSVDAVDSPAEKEADEVAKKVVKGETSPILSSSNKVQPKIQRQLLDPEKEAAAIVAQYRILGFLNTIGLGLEILKLLLVGKEDVVIAIIGKLTVIERKDVAVTLYQNYLVSNPTAAKSISEKLATKLLESIYEYIKLYSLKSLDLWSQTVCLQAIVFLKKKAPKFVEPGKEVLGDWVEGYMKDKKNYVVSDVDVGIITKNRAAVKDHTSRIEQAYYKGKNTGVQTKGGEAKNPTQEVDVKGKKVQKEMKPTEFTLFANDAQKLAILQLIWDELVGEGKLSSVQTYDDQAFTWGYGHGAALGTFPMVLKNLTKTKGKEEKYKKMLKDVGIYFDENRDKKGKDVSEDDDVLLAVDLTSKTVKSKEAAAEVIEKEELYKAGQKMELLSFFIELAENDNSKMDVLNAQWDTIRQHAGKVPEYAWTWSKEAILMAMHLSHWQGTASWSSKSYKDTEGDIIKILTKFISYLSVFAKKYSKTSYFDSLANGFVVFKYDNPANHFAPIGKGVNNPGFINAKLVSDAANCSSKLIKEYTTKIDGAENFYLIPNSGFSTYYAIPISTSTSISDSNTAFKKIVAAIELANKSNSTQKNKSLEVNLPHDPDEVEADTVAKKVVNGESVEINASTSSINRKGEGESSTSPEFETKLNNSKGNGIPLGDVVRNEMESKMGADFSQVKVHTGNEANQLNENVNAKAFAHEQDIYFRNGQYNPNSREGKELLAHELTHTVQQNNGKLKTKIQRTTLTGKDIKIDVPIVFDSFDIIDSNGKVIYTYVSTDKGGASTYTNSTTLESAGIYTIRVRTKIGDMSFQIQPDAGLVTLSITVKEDPEKTYLGKTFTTSVKAPVYAITRGNGENTFAPVTTTIGKSYNVTKPIIPINTEVSIIGEGKHLEKQKSGYKEVDVVEVADKDDQSLGWTSRANVSKTPDATTKRYKIISSQANIRSGPSDVSGPKTIPSGTEVYAKEVIRDNFKSRKVYTLVVDKQTGVEYGWISNQSLEGKIIGETMGIRKAVFESTDEDHKTIGAKSATTRVEKGVYYDEMTPADQNTVPEGATIEVLDNGKESVNYPNTKVIKVQVVNVKDAKDNAWLTRGAFWITSTYKGVADGTNFKVKKGATARTEPVAIFEATSTILAQGSFVIVKEQREAAKPKVAGKPLEVVTFAKIAYTKSENGKTVEDTDKPQVWTAAENFVGGWAEYKGLNATWRAGAYTGQTDALEIVGEMAEQRQMRPSLATDQFLLMAKAARAETPPVQLVVRSGFRDYPHQDYLHKTKPKGKAASPGYSEHQAGYAIDIDVDYGDAGYKWLQKNGPTFGFIRTVSGEPWHWEYIPADAKKYGWIKPGIS